MITSCSSLFAGASTLSTSDLLCSNWSLILCLSLTFISFDYLIDFYSSWSGVILPVKKVGKSVFCSFEKMLPMGDESYNYTFRCLQMGPSSSKAGFFFFRLIISLNWLTSRLLMVISSSFLRSMSTLSYWQIFFIMFFFSIKVSIMMLLRVVK